MTRVSRRGALAAFGTAVAASVGGCSEYLPGEEELPDFTTWLPADPLETDADSTVTVEHFREFENHLRRGHPRYQEYVELQNEYAIPAPQFDGRVFVDSRNALATVVTGSFGRDRFFDEAEYGEDQVEHREDFVLFGPNQAAGPGAYVLSSRPDRYVEARLEQRERLVDVDERWERAVRDAGDGDLVRITASAGDPHELLATSVQVEAGPTFEGTAYAYYESAEAAEMHMGSLYGHVSAMVDSGVTPLVLDLQQDGDRVAIDVGFDSIPF